MEMEFDMQIGDSILIEEITTLKVVSVRGSQVKLGFIGPHEVWRGEVPAEIDFSSGIIVQT